MYINMSRDKCVNVFFHIYVHVFVWICECPCVLIMYMILCNFMGRFMCI